MRQCDVSSVNDPCAKQIPPAEGMGGQAGGEKFVHNGILYKFARDWRGIYAGQGGAMKAAGCELRGLHAIAGANIHKLSVPLCCVVDFLGWRLVAVEKRLTCMRHGGGVVFRFFLYEGPLQPAAR